jgi:hypothetical protein
MLTAEYTPHFINHVIWLMLTAEHTPHFINHVIWLMLTAEYTPHFISHVIWLMLTAEYTPHFISHVIWSLPTLHNAARTRGGWQGVHHIIQPVMNVLLITMILPQPHLKKAMEASSIKTEPFV